MDEQNLIDTNIFLEVLLNQERTELCRNILEEHQDSMLISDFSLHSIGVSLLRIERQDLFRDFVSDLIPRVQVLTLSSAHYLYILNFHERYKLDFDDSYQLAIAEVYGLGLITLDADFRKVGLSTKIRIIR
jgi:uncharacterized protein